MTDLKTEQCEACRVGAPVVTDEEKARLQPQIPDWHIIDEDDEPKLERVYKFDNFAAALAFTNRIGAIAEEVQHHPLIITEWGEVTVRWWTHKIRNLHRNDFIMAARSDAELGQN